MNLKIRGIIKVTNGKLLTGNENCEAKIFTNDTRKIKKGDVFIGLKGNDFDGSMLWEEALLNGAETIIIQDIDIDEEKLKKYKQKNIIKVKDTKEALKQIAKAKRNLYKDLIVIGITGSSGKTSTKDIIANVLSKKYKVLKTEGNYNNSIGLPLTILGLQDHEIAVIEMGMNHLGEINELSKIAKPTISVITNIGTAHIGNLGSRKNILKAKLEILNGMEKPILIINNDNDLLNKWNEQNKKIKTYTFGIENKSDFMAEDIIKYNESINFNCKIKDEKIKINVPIGNEVFVLNSLCAISVAKILNLTNKQIQDGISSFSISQRRMEIIKIKDDITIINDSYNANPDSMISSIKYLAEFTGRKIAVLGDMLELGTFSEQLHKKIGNEIFKNKIDVLFLVGNDAKFIKQGAIENGMDKKNIFYFDSNNELLLNLKNIMKKEDTILFKASNGMKLFEVVEKLT